MHSIERWILLVLLMLIPLQGVKGKKLRVVTTTPDLADIMSKIGGDYVKVKSLSIGKQDPHAVDPRPSLVMEVKKADILIRVGMDLDLWAQSLIDASRNSKVMFGGPGYLDVSGRIKKLQIPKGKVDFRMGHIHIYGNPHYWLDPANGKLIAQDMMIKLISVMPEDSLVFERNYHKFVSQLDSSINSWSKMIEPYKGSKIITYHNSWIYFAKRFDLEIIGNVEPKPGIPPTPSHIIKLVKKIHEENVKILLIEPFYNQRIAEIVAEKAGIKVLVLPSSVGGVKGVKSYNDLFNYNISKIVNALSDQGGQND